MASSCSSRSGGGIFWISSLVLPGHVGQGADDEILEGGVALVEAPPQATRERLHLMGSNVVEPLPGEGAFAHATDGDDVEDTGG